MGDPQEGRGRVFDVDGEMGEGRAGGEEGLEVEEVRVGIGSEGEGGKLGCDGDEGGDVARLDAARGEFEGGEGGLEEEGENALVEDDGEAEVLEEEGKVDHGRTIRFKVADGERGDSCNTCELARSRDENKTSAPAMLGEHSASQPIRKRATLLSSVQA